MSSDPDMCEPPVKKERVDDELEMVNYEMQIDVPNAADGEVDPLMPVETDENTAGDADLTSLVDFIRPITSDIEIKEEFSGEIKQIESGFPKIGTVMSSFSLPRGRIPESLVVERFNSLARSEDAEFTPEVKSEICVSDDESANVEEVVIEPKSEDNLEEVFGSVDRDFHLAIGAEGPETQQLDRCQQALKDQYSSVLKAQLMKPTSTELDQLCAPDPAVDQLTQCFMKPSSHTSPHRTSPLQVQDQGMPNSPNHSPSVSIDRPARCMSNETSQMWMSDHLDSQPASAQNLDNQQTVGRNHSAFQPSAAAAEVEATVIASPVVPSSRQEPSRNSLSILQPMCVSRLLENPFSSGTWTNDQKNAIIKLSRPKPEMHSLRDVSAKRFYDEIPWLCGSSSLQKFFCWPCLLFFYSPAYTQLLWSSLATVALERGFKQQREAHETSRAHQAAEKALENWLQKVNCPSLLIPNPKQRVKNLSITEKVRKNRKPLSLLVQSICYLKKENLYANINDYLECFDFVVPSNLELLETLRDFKTNSKAFVYNYGPLVENAVDKFLTTKKSDELKMARFVTLFMEDLSSVVDNSTVVVIAHFVDKSGEIQQRIVEIDEIGYDRSASAVFMLFQRVVFQLGLRLKVAGFTYSSTLVQPSDITAFNERVERLCPVASFFHYQGHNLTGMLFGALSHLNRNCSNFFQTITELQEFFKKHLVPTFHHLEQLNHSESGFPYQSYDFDYGFITTLKRSYSSVLETFGSILASPDEWDDSVSSQAPIFMGFLQDNITRFMFVLISQLNLALVDATTALQGKIDTAEWKMLIRRAIVNFITIKNFGFDDIYLTSLSPVLVNDNRVQAPEIPANLVAIFNDIIDIAISFLHQRFDVVDFGYIDLETVASRYYTRLHLKPEEIHKFRLQIQLLAKEPTVKDKTLVEALKHFYNYNLSVAVPEYACFLDFAMTIPSSRSNLNCPAVERILHQRISSGKQDSYRNSIWMEKELLADVLKNKKVCEAIIDNLVKDYELKQFSYDKYEDLVSNR